MRKCHINYLKNHLVGIVLFLFVGYAKGQTTANNYVVTYTPRVPISSAKTIIGNTVSNVNQTVKYYDGLGRPIQVVDTKASPSQRDLVQPIAYDQYDRENVKYLPYVVSTTAPDDGSFKTTTTTDQASFYANPSNSTWNAPGIVQTGFAKSAASFEPSPLNRVVEQGFEGDNWQLSGTTGASNPGHSVKINYATNNASSLNSGTGYWVKQYGVTYLYSNDGHYLFKNSLVDQGSYPYGSLSLVVTKNENWSSTQTNAKLNTTEEYRDKLGRIVLKRTYNFNTSTNNSETLSTYYIYDDYGNLTFVLPPGVNPDAGAISQTKLNNLCYQYHYDGRKRLIEKKIPGKGWEFMIYNSLNQLIATQDSVQRMKIPQQASYIKYDSQGRVIISGYYTLPDSTPGLNYRSSIQTAADSQTILWETKSASGSYSNLTIPITGATPLIINYYDDYKISGLPAIYTLTTGISNMTKGQLTATQTAVLNTPGDKLWAIHYFDDLGRVIKNYVQHYLGGHTNYSTNNYDLVSTYYNFSNQIDTTIRQHFTNPTSTARVTITNTYDYDQVGRKLHTGEQITGSNGVSQPSVTLSLIDYNEIGQVTAKHNHLQTGMSTYLHETGYSYNERGWLTALTPIGSSGYSELIYYNLPTGTAIPQYNGTISQFSYNSPNMEAAYSQPTSSYNTVNYTYDNLSRLVKSQSILGKNDERAVYDLMGNIDTLVRSGTGAFTGTLAYNYNSQTNQLQTVYLNAGTHALKTYTYTGNGCANSDSTTKSLTYNILDMPLAVKKSGVTLATYYYDAANNKLRDVSTSAGNWDYINGIVYKNGQISFIEMEDGRVNLSGDSITYSYNYNISDYLGNVRASYDNGGTGGSLRIIQENDYYPFGMTQLYYDSSHGNRYLYNNKEQQFDLANQYDYGTRFYDPTVARWAVVDPMAEKYYSYSNYSYAVNNPILFIDPTGAEIIPVAGGYKFTEEDAISAFDIFKNKRHINVYLCITRNKNFQNQTDQDRAMSGQWDVFGVDSFEEGVDVLNALGEVADFTMDNLIIETHGSINSDHIAGIKVNDYNDNDLSQGSYIHNNELDLANGKIPNATLAHNPAIAEKLATFKKITDRITDGGKLIFASCIVGVGEAGKKFGENLNEFTGSRLNIFLAKDYVTPGWYRDKSDGSLSIWFSRMFQATWLQTKADGTQNNVQSITLSAVVGTPPVTVVPAPEKTHHKKGN